MDLKEAIMTRRSIRAFKPDPVPKHILEEIMEVARWAPSWGNTQAWSFIIAQGNTVKLLKERFAERYLQGGDSSPELPMPDKWDEVKLKRYQNLGRDLLTALSIARNDKEGRQKHYVRMHQLFDAPCIMYSLLDEGFNNYLLLDLGLILQNITLLALEKGLGTCFLAMSAVYPDIIRELIPISDSKRIVMGMAVGYPIEEHPANRFKRDRAGLKEFTTWIDSIDKKG